MRNDELTVFCANQLYKVFLRDGFYCPTDLPTFYIHKHNYAELHILLDGDADFFIDNSTYTLRSGDIILIPSGTFHACTKKSSKTKHTAFQIDCNLLESVEIHQASIEVLRDFFCEIEACLRSEDYSKISAYISLFVSYFHAKTHAEIRPITDYGFLIREFFSQRYSEDLHLNDLAGALHLSPRQTERLVLCHTGNTFRRELTATRIAIAKQLLASSDMSLAEIARYVGYSSYAGFWKAMKKG